MQAPRALQQGHAICSEELCAFGKQLNLLVGPGRESPSNVVAKTAHQIQGPLRPHETSPARSHHKVQVVPPGLSTNRMRGHEQAA